jgi:hypothetical protein
MYIYSVCGEAGIGMKALTLPYSIISYGNIMFDMHFRFIIFSGTHVGCKTRAGCTCCL